MAIPGPPVAAAEQHPAGYGQLVVRFNPKRDPGKPAYTVADCFGIEDCLTTLTQKLLQAGGNPALIRSAREERPPEVSGEESVYRFKPPAGESFCKAFLLKLSAAPSSGAFTPGLTFSASKKAAVATVRLPAGEGAPPRAWFDGILVLLTVRDAAFAESACSLGHAAKESSCRGNCQDIRL